MKIAIIIEELIQGGFQKVAINEIIQFRKIGINCDLIVLKNTNSKAYQDILTNNKIKPIYLDEKFNKLFKLNFKFPFFNYFSLYHLTYPILFKINLSKFEYTHILAHGTYTSFSAIAIAKKFNLKCISYMHDPISYILETKYINQILGKLKTLTIPIAIQADKFIINYSYKSIMYEKFIKFLKEKNINTNK
ncbi:MAG: hypothetical protein O2871_04130, partial [bacterium]|nr:hypothetical protein [bacterium]